MTVQVQLYRKQDVELPLGDEGLAEVEQRQQKLAELGFDSLVSYRRTSAQLDSARMLYPQLLGDELETWRRFLPTEASISRYTYDEVPDDALDAIKDAQEMQLFDRIEIWTPQGNRLSDRLRAHYGRVRDAMSALSDGLDPMAVGVIDYNDESHYFPITRWGEALLSVDEVKKQLRKVNVLFFSLTMLPLLLVAAAVVASIAAGIVLFGWLSTLAVVGIVAVSLFVLGIVIGVLTNL